MLAYGYYWAFGSPFREYGLAAAVLSISALVISVFMILAIRLTGLMRGMYESYCTSILAACGSVVNHFMKSMASLEA